MSAEQILPKNLLFVTGTRADFGKLEPLATACRKAGFKISFFITGMHMMSRYGETRLEVRRFENAEFFEFVNQREGDAQEMVLAKTVTGFSDFVHEHRPDLVVIHGDRVEALAASIVCAMKYIPSAHIEGGEVSGTIDESIRHCNTKLCNSHFVSSEAAKQRVLSLGESPDRVFVIGSPELDVHSRVLDVSLQEVLRRYAIRNENYGIVIFHPVTSERESIREQAEQLFSILVSSNKYFVVILPNNDPGSDEIFAVLSGLPNDRFRLIPSMRFAYFSVLLKNAQMLIGNSSAGVREAPFLGVASLNIGSRQHLRAESPSILTTDSSMTSEVSDFLQNSWGKRYPSDNGFGNGLASENFSEILLNTKFWQIDFQKGFVANAN